MSKNAQVFVAKTFQKSVKIKKISKLVPETSRCPKSIQKGSERHPKDIQKASKSFQFGSQWNQNHKDTMQRTAKNHAPYQSFPAERHHRIGTVAGCAAHWILTYYYMIITWSSYSCYYIIIWYYYIILLYYYISILSYYQILTS